MAKGKVRTCFVYIMKAQSPRRNWRYVKVGISVDPEKRRAQLQTGLPFELKILNTFQFGYEQEARNFEKIIHTRYKKYQTKNGGKEWFYVPLWQLNNIQLDLYRHDHTARLPWQNLVMRYLYTMFNGRFTEQVLENSKEPIR